MKDADAIIAGGRMLNAEIIGQLRRCRIIASGGLGVDRIDVDAATEHGIVVTNVPDVFIDEVANHATTAARARAFDMQVIAWDPFVNDDVFQQHSLGA